jgi:hypothetical protein
MTARPDENADPIKRPLIELAPLTPEKDLPPGGKFEERWVSLEQEFEASGINVPVPAQPLHLCPTCDYNLTGLTARRCPECGEPFTLLDARDRAVEKSIGFRRHFATVEFEQWKMRIGWALLVAGFLAPLFRRSGPSWWPQLQLGVRGGFMLIFAPIFLFFTCFYKVIRDTTWADAILITGIGAAMLGAAVTFL